jgi:hypothetical protein
MTLNNTVDAQFRAIDNGWPVFAFAHDLGSVATTNTASVVYTIGYVRNTLVQLLNIPNINSLRGPYYATRYPDVTDMVWPLYVLCVSGADLISFRLPRSLMIFLILWCEQKVSTIS